MRKGSNFVGTEEELEALMKSSLKNYIDDRMWFYNINESTSLSEQEIININESFAECIERGYLNDAAYHVLMNKRIYPYAKTASLVICPEGTPNEEIEKAHNSTLKDSFSLTKLGEEFLNS